MQAGIALLLAAPALADDRLPQAVYCGGLVTANNDTPLVLGAQQRLDGTRDMVRQQVDVASVASKCPANAEAVTIPGGVGADNGSPALPTPDKFDTAGQQSLYKRTPDRNVQTLGVLGQELQAIFSSRADIKIRSKTMEAGLQEVRQFTGAFTDQLRERHQQYIKGLPVLKDQIAKDVVVRQQQLAARSQVDSSNARSARDRLNNLADSGSLTIPIGAIGGLTPILQSRARSAQVEAQLPRQTISPPGLDRKSILGALDSYRWSQYNASTASGRDVQFETAKLDQDIAQTNDGADENVRRSYQRARDSLSYAAQFAQATAPDAAAIAVALIEQARSFRFIAEGRTGRVRIAFQDSGGIIKWQNLESDAPFPPGSLMQRVNAYSDAKKAIDLYAGEVRNDVSSRPLPERLDEDDLLDYADSLKARADVAYHEGRISDAEAMLAHASDVVGHVENHEAGWDARLNAEDKAEVDEFRKSLRGASADASADKFADVLGDSFLKIKDLGVVTAIFRDFGKLSAAVAVQAVKPSDDNLADCAELGLKFAFGVNYAAVGLIITMGLSLPAAPAIALGIALGVATDYTVRAVMASSAYTGPHPHRSH
jgi:hypothetical protein